MWILLLKNSLSDVMLIYDFENELISKGFDAFIVTYKGGLRVK